MPSSLDVIYHENIYSRNSSWFCILSRFSVYPEIHRLKPAASFKTITFVKKNKQTFFGKKHKTRGINGDTPESRILSGYYGFNANHLSRSRFKQSEISMLILITYLRFWLFVIFFQLTFGYVLG